MTDKTRSGPAKINVQTPSCLSFELCCIVLLRHPSSSIGKMNLPHLQTRVLLAEDQPPPCRNNISEL